MNDKKVDCCSAGASLITVSTILRSRSVRGRRVSSSMSVLTLSIPHTFELDPSALVRVIRVVMREVDQSTLVVPDVLAVHDDVIAIRDRDARADVHVVVDEQGLRRSLDLHDEALMRSGRARVIREEPRDRRVGGDLDAREMIRKCALDSRVRGGDRAARRGEDGAEDERANRYERETESPGRRISGR
jgi:hypothetical protein